MKYYYVSISRAEQVKIRAMLFLATPEPVDISCSVYSSEDVGDSCVAIRDWAKYKLESVAEDWILSDYNKYSSGILYSSFGDYLLDRFFDSDDNAQWTIDIIKYDSLESLNDDIYHEKSIYLSRSLWESDIISDIFREYYPERANELDK